MHTVGADELALDFGEEQGAQAALNATARVLAYTSSSAQNPESRPRYKNMFVEQLPKSSCLPAPPSLSQQGRSVVAPVHEGQLAPSITPDEALKKQTAPVVVFEGSGHAEVGTVRRAGDAYDDEFDYVFEGGKRDGTFHKQVFRAKAMPAHLLTNVKHEVLHEVVEEEDEEAEQGSEDEQTTGQHWQLGATTNTQPPTSAAIKLKAGSAASLVFHTPSSAFHLTSQQSHMHAQVPSVSAAAATAFDSTPSISRDSNQSEMVIHEMPIDGRLPEVDFAGASSMGTSGVGTSGLGTGTAHATSNEGYSPAAQDIAEEVLSTADEESAVEGFMDSNARTDSIAARTALGSLMDSPVHTGSILGSGVGSGLGSAMNSTVGVQPMLPPHVARALSGSTSRMGSGVGSSMGRIDSSMQASSRQGAQQAAHLANDWSVVSPSENGTTDEEVVGASTSQPYALSAAQQQDLPSFKVIQAMATAGTCTGGYERASSSAAVTGGIERESELTATGTANSANRSPKGSGAVSIGRFVGKHVQGEDMAAVWEAANSDRLAEMERKLASREGVPAVAMSYHEALLYFMTADTSLLRPSVCSTLPPAPGLFARLLCGAPPPLVPLLAEQKLQLLCLARMPFSDEEPMHMRLLCTLFAAFTGSPISQSRYGPHWASLGFQGDDPATDLRSAGMLGLLQLFYLHQADPVRAGQLYALSRHAVHEYPLAVVSLNVTLWAVQVIRDGQLHTIANGCGSLVESAQDFYTGTMYTFYNKWASGRKTMRDSGFVLREVEAAAKKKPSAMLAAVAMPLVPLPL